MGNGRRLGRVDTIALVWAALLWMWIQQYLPAGVVGSVTSIAVLWTAAYAPAVHWGVPIRRYWLALVVGMGCVGALSAIKPIVPTSLRVWSTAAILVASLVMVLRGRIRQRTGRSGP